jgi:hypothetical protein
MELVLNANNKNIHLNITDMSQYDSRHGISISVWTGFELWKVLLVKPMGYSFFFGNLPFFPPGPRFLYKNINACGSYGWHLHLDAIFSREWQRFADPRRVHCVFRLFFVFEWLYFSSMPVADPQRNRRGSSAEPSWILSGPVADPFFVVFGWLYFPSMRVVDPQRILSGAVVDPQRTRRGSVFCRLWMTFFFVNAYCGSAADPPWIRFS